MSYVSFRLSRFLFSLKGLLLSFRVLGVHYCVGREEFNTFFPRDFSIIGCSLVLHEIMDVCQLKLDLSGCQGPIDSRGYVFEFVGNEARQLLILSSS